MPDRDDRLLDLDDDVDAYEDDWEPAPEERALPPRRRRRLVTPASAALAAVLIGALGFIGGVEVQKGQADSAGAPAGGAGAARGRRSGRRRRRRGRGAGGGFAGPGGAQGNATIGSVANKRGSTLYVKDSDGNTIRVKTTSHSKINRTATATAGAIHPGDTRRRPGDEELERDDHRDADQRDVVVGGERPRRAVRRRRRLPRRLRRRERRRAWRRLGRRRHPGRAGAAVRRLTPGPLRSGVLLAPREQAADRQGPQRSGPGFPSRGPADARARARVWRGACSSRASRWTPSTAARWPCACATAATARRSSCCTGTRVRTPPGIASPRCWPAAHTVVCPDLRGYGGRPSRPTPDHAPGVQARDGRRRRRR